MLELWTLVPAIARLAQITIGSYNFRHQSWSKQLQLPNSLKDTWVTVWGDGTSSGNEIWVMGYASYNSKLVLQNF